MDLFIQNTFDASAHGRTPCTGPCILHRSARRRDAAGTRATSTI